MKSRIGITMGDPAGIGPEICLRLLHDPEINREFVPIVFGDAAILQRVSRSAGIAPCSRLLSPHESHTINEPCIVDLQAVRSEDVHPGQINRHTGQAAFAYVNAGIDAALAGWIDAVATAPLNKEALAMAGIKFPGHTEIFAARTHSARWCMMQYSEEITCTFVTVHVGYAEVPGLLTIPRILEVIELTAEGLERIRGRPPRIAVCGLNPHAGEHGLFGQREEETVIIPAMAAARKKGIQVEGPFPADTAFVSKQRKRTDAFVCMYHDQGHIPVKALAFDSAVNTTLGLPIVRTSVDHGTALDIAWQGTANPSSLFHAVRLAGRLAKSPP